MGSQIAKVSLCAQLFRVSQLSRTCRHGISLVSVVLLIGSKDAPRAARLVFILKLFYLRTIVNVCYYLVTASYPNLLMQYLALLFTKAELNTFPISDVVR